MLSKITLLVNNFVEKFPDPQVYDEAGKKVLKSFGKDFIMQSTPTSIYYSRYLTPEIDMTMSTPIKLRIKPMNYKRTAKKLKKC